MTRSTWAPSYDDRYFSKADVHRRVALAAVFPVCIALFLGVTVWSGDANAAKETTADTDVVATAPEPSCSVLNGWSKVVVAGSAANTLCSSLVNGAEGHRRIADQNAPTPNAGRACELSWEGAYATVWRLNAAVPNPADRACAALARMNGTETFYAPYGAY